MVLLHAGQRDELGPPAGACDDSIGCSSHGVLVNRRPLFATSRDGVITAACR
jgi:hypothetical protein